ncbi:hypothetical protein Tco_1132724 [Tanacetum coccineum]|uniref:Uncharacterized protein n=1 Tax=Tanacetum coccineum TaxID=301880 RepID=A0ABQ5JCW0_9ASTR
MEGFIKDDDDESRSEQMKRWNIYANYDDAYEINHEREELCEVRESSVCNVRRYMMIKYSFNNDDEYVAIKEDEYDDLTIIRKEACLAYQEIFRIMDEGWMIIELVEPKGDHGINDVFLFHCDQKNDSDDDKTQSDNENELNSEHKTDENELGSEYDQVENEEDEDDEEEVKEELVKTPSNDSDDEDETKITDKAEGDEEEEMDYTTSQLYDDVDIWLNEPVDSDKGFVQEEGTDAAMTNIQQGNENPEIL